MELYDFYADWCNLCKLMSPIVDEFIQKHPMPLHKLNIDKDTELTNKYDVKHLPTLIFVKDAKVLYKCTRPIQLEELESIYEKALKKC